MTIGMFDNDCEGRAMTEFVCLRAKMYDYQLNKEVTKKILENFHYLVYKYNYSCIDLIKFSISHPCNNVLWRRYCTKIQPS